MTRRAGNNKSHENLMKEQIKKYFNRYVTFNESEIDSFYSKLKTKTFQKKEFLLKEHSISKYK